MRRSPADQFRLRSKVSRSRWAAAGATLAVCLGAGGLLPASAADSAPGGSIFVPITPCRLLDTRPGADQVGEREGALQAGETVTIAGRGAVGDCGIPDTATALALNVAVVNGSRASYLTVFPGDAEVPLAANLNWVAAQAPTPNAVQAALSDAGELSFFNLSGSVDLSVDVNGYYVDGADLYATQDDLAATDQDVAAIDTDLTTVEGRVDDLATAVDDLATAQDDLATTVGELGAKETTTWIIANAQLLIPQRSGADIGFTTAHAGTWHFALDLVVEAEACAQANTSRELFLSLDGAPLVMTTRVMTRDGVIGVVHFDVHTQTPIGAGHHTLVPSLHCDAQNATAFDVAPGPVLWIEVR